MIKYESTYEATTPRAGTPGEPGTAVLGTVGPTSVIEGAIAQLLNQAGGTIHSHRLLHRTKSQVVITAGKSHSHLFAPLLLPSLPCSLLRVSRT